MGSPSATLEIIKGSAISDIRREGRKGGKFWEKFGDKVQGNIKVFGERIRRTYFPNGFSELVFRRVCGIFGPTPPDRQFLALETFGL